MVTEEFTPVKKLIIINWSQWYRYTLSNNSTLTIVNVAKLSKFTSYVMIRESITK